MKIVAKWENDFVKGQVAAEMWIDINHRHWLRPLKFIGKYEDEC